MAFRARKVFGTFEKRAPALKRPNLVNFVFTENKGFANPRYIKSGFEQLGPGARFSNVPKLFGWHKSL